MIIFTPNFMKSSYMLNDKLNWVFHWRKILECYLFLFSLPVVIPYSNMMVLDFTGDSTFVSLLFFLLLSLYSHTILAHYFFCLTT